MAKKRIVQQLVWHKIYKFPAKEARMTYNAFNRAKELFKAEYRQIEKKIHGSITATKFPGHEEVWYSTKLDVDTLNNPYKENSLAAVFDYDWNVKITLTFSIWDRPQNDSTSIRLYFNELFPEIAVELHDECWDLNYVEVERFV